MILKDGINRCKKLIACASAACLALAMGPAVVPDGASTAHASTAGSGQPPAFQYAENGGSSYTDTYQHVALTDDGGFVVGGYTMGASQSPEWSYAPTSGHSNNNAVLVKYDSERKIEWSHSYGEGSGVVLFNDVDILADGRIAAVGRKSAPSGIPQVDGKDVIKNVSMLVLLVDPDDPSDYTEYLIGGTAGDQGYGISATSDGGFAITGWSGGGSSSGYYTVRSIQDGAAGDFSAPVQLWQAADGDAAGMPKRSSYTNADGKISTSTDTIVAKFAKTGEASWCAIDNVAVTEGLNFGSAAEKVEALASDAQGNLIVVGQGALGKNATNATIAKFAGTDGKLLWHRSAGSTFAAEPEDAADHFAKTVYSGVDVLGDGSIVAIGTADNDAMTQEGWKTTAQKDTLVVRYSADGTVLNAETFGRIGDENSRPEGVTATPDGGYIVNGSQSGYLYEDDLITKGYTWGNYGAQDAVLIKYDANNNVEWSENYGSTNGDWFNGVAVSKTGQLVVVGESNGKFGNPSWGNNGGIDGIVLVSDGTSEGAGNTSGIVADGDVVWADGTYTATGTGYGVLNATSKNDGLMTMSVTIQNHKIAAVESTVNLETPAYYYDVEDALFYQFVEKQGVDVDVVSGATLTSNGAIEGVTKALGQAAAKSTDTLISAIAAADDDASEKAATQAAADSFSQLGTYALEALQGASDLKAAAEKHGIQLRTKEGAVALVESQPKLAEAGLVHNDRYYKIQNEYYGSIGATALADAGYTGKGVTIAVIDSGLTGKQKDLDYTHVKDGWDYGDGKTFDAESNPGAAMPVKDLYDNNGHGTAVTGILQAVSDNELGVAGLLGEADIVPLRVIPASGNNETQRANSSKQVAQAIMDAVDKFGADVITTSLDVDASDELQAAVTHAVEAGVIVTAAAGNSSSASSEGADPYLYPAACEGVIGVGAVDKNLKVRTSSQKNDSVFVTAPGENIALLDISRNARCNVKSGTSYASPVVAAMAVAAKQQNSSITVAEFKELLKKSSTDKGAEGYDTSYGHGVVNIKSFSDAITPPAPAEEPAKPEQSSTGGNAQTPSSQAGTQAAASPAVKQTIKAKKSVFKVKAKKLKKKAKKFSVKFIASGGGKVTWKAAKKGKVRIAANGKIVVAKKAKKGTYVLKVKATAAAVKGYAKTTKTVKIKVRVV